MPVSTWDRSKLLAALGAIFLLMWWGRIANVPIEPPLAAAGHVLRTAWWLDVLFVAELARQIHYLASEQSPSWHRFWQADVFGSFNQLTAQMDDWTRYRVGRAAKLLAAIVVLALVLGSILHTSPILALFEIPALIKQSLGYVALIMFYIFVFLIQFVALFWFLGKGGIETYFPGDIQTRFTDVWGQDSVLERIKENIIFLKDPESIEARGGYVPGGILLWGPPGTGKTLMAEAVAGETHNPFVFVEPAAFQNMFYGVGPLKVKSLFRKVRKLALRYGGVVVFLDEADSLGSRGALASTGAFRHSGPIAAGPNCNGMSYVSPHTAGLLLESKLSASRAEGPRRVVDRVVAGMGGMGGGDMGTLQALLTEMSGLKKPRGFVNRVVRRALGMKPKPPPHYRILLMMASNLPEALDEALLRPGRLDRIYRVGYPSKEGRVRTYQGYLAKVRHSLTPEQVDRLATITPYATGASIKDLVNEALINAIRGGRDVVTWKDVIEAKHLKTLGPPQDVEYIDRERHAVAIHEACHAVVAYHVRKDLVIDIATIEKGSTYLGMVASIQLEEQFSRWRSGYESDIMVSLASLAGEKMFFDGDNSNGVAADLEGATQIATLMEAYLGMGQTLTCHGVTQSAGIGGSRPKGGPRPGDNGPPVGAELSQRIETKLEDLFKRTRNLLADNRSSVLAVANALEVHKTITGEDVRAIIEGAVGPLIDGRWYHRPEFAADAERYHAMAVQAHRDHSKIDVPLPRSLMQDVSAGARDEAANGVMATVMSNTEPHSDEGGQGRQN